MTDDTKGTSSEPDPLIASRLAFGTYRVGGRCGLWKAAAGTVMPAARSPREMGRAVPAMPRRTWRKHSWCAGVPRSGCAAGLPNPNATHTEDCIMPQDVTFDLPFPLRISPDLEGARRRNLAWV